jgi:hypothetical protein
VTAYFSLARVFRLGRKSRSESEDPIVLHVELIQNEWAAGQQRVVARLLLDDTRDLKLETSDEQTWESIAFRPFQDPASGRELSPDGDPEGFLRSLHLHLKGDYLFATEAHQEGQCEYEVGTTLPLSAALPADRAPTTR